MRIITHDDLKKKQLKEIIAHYKTLLKHVAKELQFSEKKKRTKMCRKEFGTSIIIKA